MKAIPIKPHEAPVHILRQKDWDVEVFYRYAVQDPPEWHTYLLEEDGEQVALIILTEQPLFDDVCAQTVIVDKDHRTPENTIRTLQICRRLMLAVARAKGYSNITGAFPQGPNDLKPKALMRILARDGFQGYVLETVIREKVVD